MATCDYVWTAEKRKQIDELVAHIEKNKNISHDCAVTLSSDEMRLLKIALEYLNDNFEDAIHRHMGSIDIGEVGMHFQNATYPCVPDKWQITRLLRQLSPEEDNDVGTGK